MNDLQLFYTAIEENFTANVPIIVVDPLQEEHQKWRDCKLCSLSENRKGQVTFGHGACNPKVMFIALAPSEEDSKTGIPFNDGPGSKIHGIIEYIDRKVPIKGSVYLCTYALCPGSPEEKIPCSVHLSEEIKIVNPSNIILVGAGTSLTIFGSIIEGRHMGKFDKYYATYCIKNSLIELFYKRDEVFESVKRDLDFIVKEIKA